MRDVEQTRGLDHRVGTVPMDQQIGGPMDLQVRNHRNTVGDAEKADFNHHKATTLRPVAQTVRFSETRNQLLYLTKAMATPQVLSPIRLNGEGAAGPLLS